jgi:DNA-directed RNA polymerase subunit L
MHLQLELVEKGENSRMIRIIDEDHTLCNLLRHELQEEDKVLAASYTLGHPLTEHPKFFVKAEKSPERVMADVADKIAKDLEDLHEQLQKALKGK